MGKPPTRYRVRSRIVADAAISATCTWYGSYADRSTLGGQSMGQMLGISVS
jgi:hypothetical protein